MLRDRATAKFFLTDFFDIVIVYIRRRHVLFILLLHLVVVYVIAGFLVTCLISVKPNVKEPDIVHVIYTFIIVLILWPLFVSELFSKE